MRKFIGWVEFGFLLLVQLAMIAWYLSLLVSGTAKSAAPQGAASSESVISKPATPAIPITIFLPTKLEAYLNQFPVSKGEAKQITKERDLQRWGDTYRIARQFKHKMAYQIVYDAREHFETDCKAAGGKIELMTSPYVYAYETKPTICLRSDGIALGALIARHDRERYGDAYVDITLMSPSAAAAAKA
jgi:hypothetical protein